MVSFCGWRSQNGLFLTSNSLRLSLLAFAKKSRTIDLDTFHQEKTLFLSPEKNFGLFRDTSGGHILRSNKRTGFQENKNFILIDLTRALFIL